MLFLESTPVSPIVISKIYFYVVKQNTSVAIQSKPERAVQSGRTCTSWNSQILSDRRVLLTGNKTFPTPHSCLRKSGWDGAERKAPGRWAPEPWAGQLRALMTVSQTAVHAASLQMGHGPFSGVNKQGR